jgi:hypothetical protein
MVILWEIIKMLYFLTYLRKMLRKTKKDKRYSKIKEHTQKQNRPWTINCVNRKTIEVSWLAFSLSISLLFEKILLVWVLVSFLIRTHDWQVYISHHKPTRWFQAEMIWTWSSVSFKIRVPEAVKFALHG